MNYLLTLTLCKIFRIRRVSQAKMTVSNQANPASKDTGKYYFKIFHASLNLIAHLLIGAVVGICLIFSYVSGAPLGPIPLHIVLCVIGYQLLMSEAILSLSPDNGWSASLRLVDKRRAHTVVEIVGSALALAGCAVVIVEKEVNWDTIHGQTALVSMIFTVISFVNGVTSLYAYEWRRFLPGNLSKISHIVCGVLAYAFACVSLVYGYEKASFTRWATEPLKNATIAFTVIFTFIVLINPALTCFSKTKQVIRK